MISGRMQISENPMSLAAFNVLIGVSLVCIELEIYCHNFHISKELQHYITENSVFFAYLNVLLVSVALVRIVLQNCCYNLHNSNKLRNYFTENSLLFPNLQISMFFFLVLL